MRETTKVVSRCTYMNVLKLTKDDAVLKRYTGACLWAVWVRVETLGTRMKISGHSVEARRREFDFAHLAQS